MTVWLEPSVFLISKRSTPTEVIVPETGRPAELARRVLRRRLRFVLLLWKRNTCDSKKDQAQGPKRTVCA